MSLHARHMFIFGYFGLFLSVILYAFPVLESSLCHYRFVNFVSVSFPLYLPTCVPSSLRDRFCTISSRFDLIPATSSARFNCYLVFCQAIAHILFMFTVQLFYDNCS